MTKHHFPAHLAAKALEAIKFTCYFGTFVHTPELGRLEALTRCAVGVDETGTIAFVQENCQDYKKYTLDFTKLSQEQVRFVDVSDSEVKFFVPGFIDTHIHAPQFPNNGIFGDSTLMDWLEKYTFPLESSFKDVSLATEIYNKVVDRTLSNGTTAAAYYATIHAEATNLLADVALTRGQRALIGKVCMNQNSPDHYIETFEESKQSQLEVIRHVEARDPTGTLVSPVLTPRFAPSCTENLMEWLGELRKSRNYHCQTHLSENKREIEVAHELFPDYDSYTDIYHKSGLLGPKTILAHCIHLSDHEKDLLAQTGSGVSHCPTSNSSITSGEARIRWLLNSNVKVSLGTDCSGGFTPSVLQVAKHALLVSNHLVMKSENDFEKLSTSDVLYLATVGGAEVLNMDVKLGKFQVGYKFDTQLIQLDCDNSPVDTFAFQNPRWGQVDRKESIDKFQDLIDKWIFNGDDRNVRQVFVNGRSVLQKN
ncbi:hypothetical protein OGAPHI_006138 [Ogataea philodendri]|uniref:Guanine deaminase n=1 Tax=Ogataea philodendri TaxID=1378263 RepID=A0A9P8NYT4_9ASCO|nr:uncharacterized protein OGAPHI_006138 [Ogataea philodendri]KAH3661959.1 hypothetical protein OGAPHI_006138 [Ogataea philodendri]